MKTQSLALFVALWAAPAAAEDWVIQTDQSTLSLTGVQQGEVTTATIGSFGGGISYTDGGTPEGSADITLCMESLSTGSSLRDEILASEQWFNVADFPAAQFTIDSFRRSEDGSLEAAGALTIKGEAHPLTLPFSVDIEGDTARATAEMELDRLALGVGWDSDDRVAYEVTLELDLRAVRAEPGAPPFTCP